MLALFEQRIKSYDIIVSCPPEVNYGKIPGSGKSTLTHADLHEMQCPQFTTRNKMQEMRIYTSQTEIKGTEGQRNINCLCK
ncbi:hypothetical protein MNV_1510015 [Candidatus Methanoperedens nitroreducens]|uniref:Uncharacterized protein n=1 Tax=Candidatus Methanoperedens nitratireducens TaxID=1392998 RepID=A0A284VLA0_9EURY|nr:hypothetical protein MNV_1510015 [Candidatus Methanoperedens nitroreducens]